MGFDDDELNEHKQIELTKDEVTMTMNDLQMELMKHKQEEEENKTNDTTNVDMDIVVKNGHAQLQQDNVDMSFMNDVMSANNNEKNEDVSNEIVGNGNAPSHEIVEN